MHSAGVRWFSDTIHLSSSPRQHSISDNGRSREPLYGAQMKEIILQHGKLGGPTRVCRWFVKQYKDMRSSSEGILPPL